MLLLGGGMVLFTSFLSAPSYIGRKFSISTFQPQGYSYSDIECLLPLDRDGQELRSSRQVKDATEEKFWETVDRYRQNLLAAYFSRWDEIRNFCLALPPNNGEDIIIAAWAPNNAAAKRHTLKYGKFVCHSGIVAGLISIARPDLSIFLDQDRNNRLPVDWQGIKN